MKYARVVDGVVNDAVELGDKTPADYYPQPFAGQFIQIPDDVQAGYLYDGETFTAPEPVNIQPPQPALLYTYKTDVWKRMNDDEAEQFKAEMEAAGAKYQGMWNDAQRLEHDDPYFEVLRNSMVDVYGEDRTNELLAPSLEG